MWERLFSIPIACLSLASKLRTLANRFCRVRASSHSAYLQSLYDWQFCMITALISVRVMKLAVNGYISQPHGKLIDHFICMNVVLLAEITVYILYWQKYVSSYSWVVL